MSGVAHSPAQPRRGSAFPLPVQAAMIDLDGTLLDTVNDLAAAANMMREALGLAPIDPVRVRDFVGKGIPVLVRRALTDRLDGEPEAALFDRALTVFYDCYESVNGRAATIYPGVIEGLDAFRAAGLPLACVTNKSERFTIPLLKRMRLDGYFPVVVAGDTLPKKKPHPLPLIHACERLGVAPRAMLMVGDSGNDVLAARAAGCPVFCVSYGYNEGADVRSLDVDAIVSTLFDAVKLITQS